jgi:tetratricopeptide (TPR) repeat protein
VQRQWPWWLLVALAVAALLAHPGYRSLVGNSLQVREPASAMLTQLHAVAWLLGQWAWPVALNIDPDLPQISAPIDVWPELLGLLLAGVLAWQCRRQRPWISLGIVWAALHLLLFNAVFPRDDIANERLLYWGDWALIFAVATELQLRVPLRALRVAGVTLACVLALATAQRNHVYRSEVALWEDTARKSPHKARVLNNLGHAYGENGQPADAERAYRAALRIDPDYTKAINNLERLHQAAADAAPD